MSLWKNKVSFQKVGVISLKARNVKILTVQQNNNALWVSVAGRENISPIILAQTEMTWICTRLQRVIAAENLTACKGYESTRHTGTNDVILLTENVNRMMGLRIRNTPTVFKDTLMSKPSIQWPKIATWTNLDQELSFLLTTGLKGPINQQITSFCRIIYDVYGVVWCSNA